MRSYKSLGLVERAWRCIKTVDLHVRPVYHWLADRVRAHVFLCMLAYYLEWHMRQRLASMLFDDTDKEAAEAERKSVVAQAQRSKAAVKKQTTGLTPHGLPVHSFRSLLADLATLARNTIITAIAPLYPLTVLTRPTSTSQRVVVSLAQGFGCLGEQRGDDDSPYSRQGQQNCHVALLRRLPRFGLCGIGEFRAEGIELPVRLLDLAVHHLQPDREGANVGGGASVVPGATLMGFWRRMVSAASAPMHRIRYVFSSRSMIGL